MVQLCYNGKVNNKKHIEVKSIFINVERCLKYMNIFMKKTSYKKLSLEIFFSVFFFF